MMHLNRNPSLPEFDYLREIQQAHCKAFHQRGFPTSKEERWKYTDLSLLAKHSLDWPKPASIKINKKFACQLVFVNGYFCSQESSLPEGVILKPLSQLSSNDLTNEIKCLLQNEDIEQFPMASLNAALMGDGCFLYVPKNIIIKDAIHFLFINNQQNNFHLAPCNIIFAENNSEVTVIEEYVGEEAENYLTNTVTVLQAKENSKVYYYKIQKEHHTAIHLSTIKILQEKNSMVNSFYLGLGGKLVREDLHVLAQGENSETELSGLYHLKHELQHVDNHLVVDHQASHGKSTMFYKGILEKKSSAVFNGKVHVEKHKKQINAKQTNRNLLLSNAAEVNTKPELEIYADDVKCVHGATVGYLNQDEIFYLRSRGLTEQEARELLIKAFAEEALQKITNSMVLDYIFKGGYAALS